ncbi:ABC transporter ATP-binding protein [Clavibacter michiganensis]|uniref:ABC transporter ATP-binding protein n=1 Tax=Clavibacter michiganensis TaxID=28447 RepID=UPI0026DC17EA|nr:ATP-binding cassette domain-containing protein [Clavibacter michiganensis]MDO4064723.1 ATP-binding cassette domain-containing protein [Clavibacter michiganensis]MDO4071143.1 ATP-binding cassette domain-containing protein [Clavibacter michiganensis]MDO4090429.1 ATP-binding cassette domain-containing protein [Clavibacter michiganensis]
MTDAPDETTSPDATSDSSAEPRDHADSAAAVPAEDPPVTALPAEGPAAVPRLPRPGQRVPRRATAPSPRTAPAVVVAPTPPRVKSIPVVAPASRLPVSADDAGESTSAASRPPRVRRRTRVQRAAGSAEAVVASEDSAASDVAEERTATGMSVDSPTTPAEVPDAADPHDAGPTAPDQDGLTQLSSMFSDADRQPTGDPVRPVLEDDGTAPTDVVSAAAAADGPDPASADADPGDPVGVEATDPGDAVPDALDTPDAAAEPDASVEPEPEPLTDHETALEPTAEAEAQAAETSEQVVDDESANPDSDADAVPGPGPDPEPGTARAVTVRTDSLTAPRSTRPGLAGVAETALTPSVRGDRAAAPELGDDVLVIEGLTKRFDEKVAVDDIALTVRAGSFYGIVGPNGAGKTTTMSMVTGLLRPDAGTVTVNGIDVWREPLTAKRSIGVLPDRLRLFDRLTGAQLLHYSGALRGLPDSEIRSRSADLVAAFGLEDAVGRLVTDYSAGMTKKVALACAMIHSPRMLVLDEPFESVDPVSAANVVEILQDYVAHGGTVVLSSHGMDFIQRICDHVAIIVNGRVLAAGTMDEVRAGRSLEERFVALAGGRRTAEGFSWLHSFSD